MVEGCPSHGSFENRWRNMDILYIILKGIIWRFRFSLNFSKICWFRDFMNKFSRNDSPMAPEWVSENISNLKYEYIIYTILQNKRMRRCRVPPPPIIFEDLSYPQQIIYCRKENLSESPNHFKYWKNILISRFYEQFSRSSRNLGHFWKFEKISNLLEHKHIIYHFEAGDLEMPNI